MQKLLLRDTQTALPTTAKLFGGIGLAATGFFGVALMMPYLPPGSKIDGAATAAVSIGLALGWRVIGLNPGKGARRMVERGLSASVYLMVATLAFLGALQMLQQMWRGRYEGPFEAITDIAAQGAALAGVVLRPDVLAVLFLGGLLSAMLSDWAWKRWQ